MWVFSTTIATSAQASSAAFVSYGQTFYSTSVNIPGGTESGVTFVAGITEASEHNRWIGPFSEISEIYYTLSRTEAGSIPDAYSSTHVARHASFFSTDFTRTWSSTSVSISESWSPDNGSSSGESDATGETTTTRSMGSYLSGTFETTTARAIDTTTTDTTERTVVTTAAGPTTSATTETITHTTSTTSAGSAAATAYATAPSTTLNAPVSLVPVSVVEVSEQAWEITATTQSGGFVSDVATEFTSRVGTAPLTSATLPVVNTSDAFSTSYEEALTVEQTETLTTTTVVDAVDTYVPWLGVLPATSTSTRVFPVLTTSTITLGYASYTTGTTVLAGFESAHHTEGVPVLTRQRVTLSVTGNASPTQTTEHTFHLTYWATTTRRLLRHQSVLTTASGAVAAGGVSTSTATEALTQTYTEIQTNTNFGETTRTEITTLEDHNAFEQVDECGLTGPQVDEASDQFVDDDSTYRETSVLSHEPPLHTLYVTQIIAYPTTTTVTDESWTTTEELTFTETTGTSTGTTSYTSESGYSFTDSQRASFTYPQRFSPVTWDGSVRWTGHQLHARPGFRAPLELAWSHAAWSMLSIAGSTLHLPAVATQNGSDGPRALFIDTDATHYSSGVSIYTARWQTSDSKLHWSSAHTSTYTTTASTATLTRTTVDGYTTGAASVSGVGEAWWYAPQPTTAASQGSKIGGVIGRAEYQAGILTPPGVRHWTRQDNGTTTTSFSEWHPPEFFDLGGATNTNGYAFPTQRETAIWVTQEETFASITHIGPGGGFDLFYPLGYTVPANGGATSRPVVTLSLTPDL